MQKVNNITKRNSTSRITGVRSYTNISHIHAKEHVLIQKQLISNVIPVAVPIPIKDDPAFCMMARTSAKSTLTNPGT